MIFDYLFLPVLIFIVLITSYQDLKYGKIKNKWIVLGLAYGFLVILFFLVWDLAASPVSRFYWLKIKQVAEGSAMPVFTVSFTYLKALLINFLVSVLVGFLMWRFKAWSAGDAKLFFVFSLLLPLKYYSKTYLPLFPAFALLTNIFVPVFAFFAIKALIFCSQTFFKKIKEKKITPDVRAIIKSNAPDILRLFIAFVSMFLLAQLFQRSTRGFLFNGLFSQMAALAIMYLVSSPLTKILRQKWILLGFIILLLVALGGGFIYFKASLTKIVWQVLTMVIVFLILVGLIRKALDFYIKERGISEIMIEELKPHSQLSQDFLSDIKREAPEVYQSLKEERYWPPESLALLKSFCLSHDRPTIKVYKSFPFAIWMLAGLALTIALKGSVLSYIFKMVQ